MFERILVPTDGSPNTDTVIERALELGDPATTTFHSIYVIDVRALLPLPETEQRSVAESLNQRGETALQSVTDAVERKDGSATTNVVHGVPAGQIIAYAKEFDIDAIVLGSHGHTMRKQAIGSTTERVVQGIHHLTDAVVVVVPIGADQLSDARDRELSEQAKTISDQAKDMFQ